MDTEQAGTVEPARSRPLRLDVFGVRWDLTFHGLSEGMVDRLHELWARAAAPPEPIAPPEPTAPPESTALPQPAQTSRGPESEQSLAVEELTVARDRTDVPGLADNDLENTLDDITVVGEREASIPYSLSRNVTLRSITRRRGQALMLHAVGVCGPDGRSVALVAPSGTGKTTAARSLGRTLGYLTDETVVLEPDDRISPYPKPLSIIGNPDNAHDKHELSPDELGLLPLPADVDAPRINAVVILRRDPEAVSPQLEPLPLLDAIFAVIPETSALPFLPNSLHWLCRVLTKGGGPYRLTYAEIDDCVDLVTSLTSAEAGAGEEPLTWEHLPGDLPPDGLAADPGVGSGLPVGDGQNVTPSDPIAWGDTLERCPWTDAVVSDGEAVLLRGLVPVRLSHLGTVLWLNSGRAAPIAALHDLVVARIGHHDRSAALVLEAAQALVDADVLRRPQPAESPQMAESPQPFGPATDAPSS